MAYLYATSAVCITIFSTGGKFHPVSNVMQLHALTQVTRSYLLEVLDILSYEAKLEETAHTKWLQGDQYHLCSTH